MAPILVVRIASLVYANLSSGAVDHVLDVGDMSLVVRLRPDDDPSSSDALAKSVVSAVDVGGTCPSSGRLAQFAAQGELDVAKLRGAEDVSDEFSGEAKAARANNGNPEDRPVPPLIRSLGRARSGLRALPLRFPACRGSALLPGARRTGAGRSGRGAPRDGCLVRPQEPGTGDCRRHAPQVHRGGAERGRPSRLPRPDQLVRFGFRSRLRQDWCARAITIPY